jgi:hypothetical protein
MPAACPNNGRVKNSPKNHGNMDKNVNPAMIKAQIIRSKKLF